MISHQGLARFLAGLAEDKGIPHQLAVKEFGRTDAAEGQVDRSGDDGLRPYPRRYGSSTRPWAWSTRPTWKAWWS